MKLGHPLGQTVDSSPQQVLVTGATGYLAGWIIQKLLAQGHQVNATVRDLSHSSKTRALVDLAADLPGELELFQADLLREGSFKRPMMGCTTVFHVASPFSLQVGHPQRDLIDPAVKGTQNVLHTVNSSKTVNRVVLTSSVVAMVGDWADLKGHPVAESDWNTTSTLDHNPYALSKTLAERAAWDMQGDWSLAVINPALVVGPTLNPDSHSGSFDLIQQLAGDAMATVCRP